MTAVGSIAEVERVFREVHGHAVATLVRAFGDIDTAEDAVQDAFVVATRRWPDDGIPANPAGWIVTTARNRAVDQFRRTRRGAELARSAAQLSGQRVDVLPEPGGSVVDERLRLIFTCCHPSLRIEHQVALTLRLLGGLDVEEIARAFLVTDAAMAKRLTRAKYKIRVANIAYRVPEQQELPARLRPVLSVLYLIYNAGTDDLGSGGALRKEAIRLARVLATLLPDEPEAGGLLALLLLNESRVAARTIGAASVLLRDQDRSKWDRSLIAEGHAIVRRCIRLERPGPFQLQAAIQAVHCHASTFEATDWSQIVSLYDHLYALNPSPIVGLNRAIAVAEIDGHIVALGLLDEIASDLDNYYPLHAARAASLQRLERNTEAVAAIERAHELATSNRDRQYFADEIARLRRLEH